MNHIKNILIVLFISLLAACGGGGGGGSTGTVINGVASKGIIANGTATVFALNTDGSKGLQLGTGSTDGVGAYSINIGNYTGPIMVEAYGGYIDEATGRLMTVPASSPLRAVMANAAGTVSLSVTPLTDLAVRQAGTLTQQNITAANALISDLFKVDITSTPAAPTAAAFQSSITTQAQKDYALVLAAVSQLMTTGGTLEATLTSLNSGISKSGMSQSTATNVITAINNFITNPTNKTGVTTVAGTSLQAVGATSITLIIGLQGSTTASVMGIQTTVTLPAGVVLRADSAGRTLNGVIKGSDSAPAGLVEGKYTAAANGVSAKVSIGFVTLGGFKSGDVMIINADLAPGVSIPETAAFTLSSSKLVDVAGNVVIGAFLTMR